MSNRWYKNEAEDSIWWKETGTIGEFIFSFDKEKEFNLFEDYPYQLSSEQLRLFDKENPYWAKFFEDRK